MRNGAFFLTGISNLTKIPLASAIPLLVLMLGGACSGPLPASGGDGPTEPQSPPAAQSVSSSSPRPANPADFVQIRDGRFRLEGRPFVLKGTNYFGSWRGQTTIPAGENTVHGTVWAFYHNWNPAEMDLDFQFLRSQLNATAVRIGTPALSDFANLVRYHDFQPWYNPDGTITDHYKNELIQLADIAYKNNIRIQFCLLWHLSEEIEKDGDAFKPGGKMDAFYSHQIRSVAAALRDHPGVMAYSVGNEVLIKWKLNGTHTSWFEARAGGFILRRLRELRATSPHQLLTVDEGAGHANMKYWHCPGVEFSLLPDVDNSNGNHAFRLSDQVDYHGGHFYPEMITSENLSDNAEAKLTDADVQLTTYMKAARADGKPVILGEFGLQLKQETLAPGQYPQFAALRDEFIKRVMTTGQTLGLQGALYWLALPGMILRPGHFSIEPSKENKYSPIELHVEQPDGRMHRVLFYDPYYSLFTWAPTGDTPSPTPAAKAIAAAWPDVPPPLQPSSASRP